jgi:hypothetical protein
MESDDLHYWDQLPGEAGAAYARFLIYRNLGPARSLQSAYQAYADSGKVQKGSKKLHASGQWQKDAKQFEWAERAQAWDIHMLTHQGREVVLNFIAGLQKLSQKALAALSDENIKPSDWHSVVNAINTIGNFIPGETVVALQDRAASDAVPRVGASGRRGE